MENNIKMDVDKNMVEVCELDVFDTEWDEFGIILNLLKMTWGEFLWVT